MVMPSKRTPSSAAFALSYSFRIVRLRTFSVAPKAYVHRAEGARSGDAYREAGLAVRHLAALAATLLSAQSAVAFELTSPDVKPDTRLALAQVHTECGGSNVSPALNWTGAPDHTKSFVVTLYDPDANGGWWHWIVYNIPATATGIPSGGPLPSGSRAGKSDFGKSGYGGACPPPGSGLHHYQFTVWALGSSVIPVEGAETGAIIGPYLTTYSLAHATLTATYER
jgi:Raf kinase inhibitor-like YbhB/YbcL family protein